ncbi:spore maturation protein A [Clostridium acetobutylicum]|uniref:Spore maturation protein A (Gene spmA) n=1 Tax=Clostridium acetobutylicum (strain ATCC 824 / DSM 792 / JCM 1419 / IAM 19013 / LMG 5710 / NBRC 13948 / NRRL B-527 / VKM B-1787 / 2291 / W) TaxID=272562 RepID=Q97LT5_CLOAB|nr:MULTISPECIES: nucleoside recognition domain-containing protein [Clostridium]AAK78449.1 Spore maturation protein A (gene spmA) [Clostridium acetobutylicum ATCC 824]ADZ19519.1 Spore maturation protein A (gene spmA) [Clostridium acetobutylicum EA 2018]AEI33642.1 spore maturation protein A, spmA [Clostridium acetobutylicum DSM 1731]AWV80171.1 spore maturation protein [Clostridium acetobutylicum]MBC2392352.1 spore maturation protein [Clostridium acetobutylicum]
MINYIWFIFIFVGTIVGVLSGNGSTLSSSIINSTESSVKLMISLLGIMCLWCGVMRIAEKSGLTDKLSIVLRPILKIVFKDISKNNNVMGPMIMNITSNMLGLGNAATPFGIKTMEEMQKINKKKSTATNDMAKFLVINAACIQLLPTTIISIRAACGSSNPAIIVIPTIVTSVTVAIMGLIYCKILQRHF